MITTPGTELESVTVNVEALWVLQALLDIPTLASELRGLPYGAARDTQWLAADPRVETLRRAGLVGPDGAVIEPLARRLGVLAVPDVEIVILVSAGKIQWPGPIEVSDPRTWELSVPADQLSVVLARRDGRWASAVRGGADITVDDVEVPAEAAWVAEVVRGLLDAFCPGEPSRLPAMNLPLADLQAGVSPRRLGVPAAAVAEFTELQSPAAEAVIYARGYTDARVSHGVCTLNVRTTPAGGRACFYREPTRPGADQEWMTVVPASATQLAQGVRTVLAGVKVPDWAQHRRMG